MNQQINVEKLIATACGPDVLIICDSSALNALLYMSEECLAHPDTQDMIKATANHYDILFYCTPIPALSTGFDPNRVHSQAQGLEIDARIPKIMERFAPEQVITPLFGNDAEKRRDDALYHIYQHIMQG
jgi:hypothetical protein